MNKQITTLALLLLFPVLFFVEEQNALPNDKDLSVLSSIFLKSCIKSNEQIKQAIKEKNHYEIYTKVDKIIKAKMDLAGKRMNHTYSGGWTHESIEDKNPFLAQENIYKIIATIPLLTLDEKYENLIGPNKIIDDIQIKSNAAYAMMREGIPQAVNSFGINPEKIKANRVEWASQILKTLKNAKKEAASKKIYIPKNSPGPAISHEQEKERQKQITMHSINENRKIDLDFAIDFFEHAYASMLLRTFPGDASRIKQAVRNAGYEGKEVNEMLFRTLNEYSDAEFLFKGKSKK